MSFGVSPDVPPQEGDVQAPPVDYPSVVAGLANLAASASPQQVDSFDTTIFRATEYLLTVSQGSTYQVAKIVVLSDGTNTFVEVFGLMSSTGVPLATFTASMAANVANLNVTLLTVAVATVNFQAIRVLA